MEEDDNHSIDISEGSPGRTDFRGPCKFTIPHGYKAYRRSFDIHSGTLTTHTGVTIEIPVNQITVYSTGSNHKGFGYSCTFPSTPDFLAFLQEDPHHPQTCVWWGMCDNMIDQVIRIINNTEIEITIPLYPEVIFRKPARRRNGYTSSPQITLPPWFFSNSETYTIPPGSYMTPIRLHITESMRMFLEESYFS
jgi:hypothetical protein